MAHHVGPKARVNRRLGTGIYDSSGALRASHRRILPPGQQGQRRRRPSDYGRALQEKQKVRHYYGLSQRQLRRFYQMAKKLAGNTGENLLLLCERRLDNVFWKAGFTHTRAQARQAISHGHVLLNGRGADVPSILVNVDDVIQVRKRENLSKLYKATAEEVDRPPSPFLAADKENLLVKVARLPDNEDVGLPVNISQVIEFLSR
jgi:small subunit ribosomal protein S4